MLLPDVNVLVSALREDSVAHPLCHEWLQSRLRGPEPVGMSELVLSGVIRVMTNHRVFNEPTSPGEAVDLCTSLLAAPAAHPLRPGIRHWEIFAGLCREGRYRANDVADAYHAALAIENGATFVTFDRGFRRFSELRVEAPYLN